MKKIFKLIFAIALTMAGYNAIAMEKDEPAVEQSEVSRSYALANEIVEIFTEKYELKSKEIEQLKKLIKRIDKTFFIIKPLLDEEKFNEIENVYINILNSFLYEWSKEVGDSDQKFRYYKDILITTLEQLLLLICSNKVPSGLYLYLLQIKPIDFSDLFSRTVEILLTSNHDCFDAFILYAKEYNLNEYATEVLSKFEQNKDFSDTFYKLIIKTDKLNNLRIFISESWNKIIDENTLNKNVKAEAHATINNITNLCLLLAFVSTHSRTVQDRQIFKQILQKLITEPTIRIENWLDALNKIRDNYEHLKKIDDNDINFFRGVENLASCLGILERAINWKLQKINLIRTKLIDAINNQDVKITKKLANSLYTITRNFENENGDTPLHIAVLTQNKDLIKALLSIYPEQMLVENNDGKTPLHIAAAANQDILKFIMNLLYKIDENSRAQQNLNLQK